MKAFVIVVCAIIVLFTIKYFIDKQKNRQKLLKRIRSSFGACPDTEFTYERYESIGYFYRTTVKGGKSVDNITWNDLDMDEVFLTINNTCSSIGEEYLYYLLRTPSFSAKVLGEREKLIEHFRNDTGKREQLQILLSKIGRSKNISVYEYISRLYTLEKESNFKHYLQAVLLVGAIALIFIDPTIGIICTLIMFFTNILTYFKRKSDVESFYFVVSCIMRMIDTGKEIVAAEDEAITEYQDKINAVTEEFKTLRVGAGLVAPKDPNSDLLQSLLDYVRMAFHVDLIKFNNMHRTLTDKQEQIKSLFESIGYLDAMIAVASFREYEGRWCLPEFTTEEKRSISVENMYHPLISEPVDNSFTTSKCCLVTGSNASGKSTFLKTAAINIILAQTVNTVLADSYKASFFKVYSSMALKDSLENGESYYIVEIKSLKRIFDAIGDDVPVFCVIDEVLRGTNTLERIAASSQILGDFATRNAVCIAATHDIELSYILENYYNNYHFEEHIDGNDISFDYKLKEGRAVTRNAINLLKSLGYSQEIVDRAKLMADEYLKTNEWQHL